MTSRELVTEKRMDHKEEMSERRACNKIIGKFIKGELVIWEELVIRENGP